MYVFGGKDDENNKLNDTWKFHINSSTWEEVKQVDEPVPRSGHAACIFKDYMIIYGGIFDICKELNDMHIFDMRADRWLCLFEELHSPQVPPSPEKVSGMAAAEKRLSKAMTMKATAIESATAEQATPIKAATASPSKKKKFSLTKAEAVSEDKETKYECATSIRMKNSYLIKNANASFEKNYAVIRKRAMDREKTGVSPSNFNESLTKT